MLSNESRGIEEFYTSAGNSSNLTVEADRRGDGDVLIAAGWSPGRLGAALLRLHSEWDGAEKPKAPTRQAVVALAATMKGSHEMRMQRAQAQAGQWYEGELVLLVRKLKVLPEVRQQLLLVVRRWQGVDAEQVVPAVLRFWLDQTCPKCHGLRWQMAQGAPALSGRVCRSCAGSGLATVPHEAVGRRLAGFMDDCVSCARASIKKRLHARTARA